MTTILDRMYWNTITGSVKITYSMSEKVQQDMDGRLKQLMENGDEEGHEPLNMSH